MKKAIFCWFLFLLVFVIYGQEVNLDTAIREAANDFMGKLPGNTRMAITNFGAPINDISEYIVDGLLTHFLNSRKYSIVDRRFIDQARNELNFNMSGEVSDETAQSIGRFIGAQVVIFGSLRKVGNVYRFQLRAIKVETMELQGLFTINISQRDLTTIFGAFDVFEGTWLISNTGNELFDNMYIIISGNEVTLRFRGHPDYDLEIGNVAKGIIIINNNRVQGTLTHIWGGWMREDNEHNYWMTVNDWNTLWRNEASIEPELCYATGTIHGNRIEANWVDYTHIILIKQ